MEEHMKHSLEYHIEYLSLSLSLCLPVSSVTRIVSVLQVNLTAGAEEPPSKVSWTP